MNAMMFRDEAKIGRYVDATDVSGLEYPLAMLETLGQYVIKWVCHKLFSESEMVLVKLELAD